METLLEKIKASTQDGSPSVTQLIELQELARTLKVTKSQLDKLIEQEIQANKEVKEEKKEEHTREDYDANRTDFGSARNSFEEEMNQRRQEVSSSFDREEIVFDRPEITFDPVEVNFDTPEPEIEKKEPEPISPPEPIVEETSEPIENIESFTQHVVEEVEEEVQKFQQGEISHTELEETIKNLSEETNQFQQELENQQEELEYIVGEEETYENKEEDLGLDEHDGFLSDFIKHRERELRNEVNREEEPVEEPQEEPEPYREERSYEPEPSRESLYNNSNSKAAFKQDLEDDQKIFFMGIGSIILPFIFGVIGGALGIYTLSLVRKAEENYNLAPNSYHDDSFKKVKSGKTMAVIGVVIAALRLLSFITMFLRLGF